MNTSQSRDQSTASLSINKAKVIPRGEGPNNMKQNDVMRS